MDLPARKTLSVLALLLLAFSFVGLIPVGVAHAVTSTAVAEQNTGPSQATFAGFGDVGPLPSGLNVVVNIEIPLRNQGLLSSLAKEVSDPSSPMFRQFLTQRQIQQFFEPTAQFDSMMGYLTSVGLRVIGTSLDSVIVVSASVAQVQKYLHTPINLYSNGTVSYYMSGASGLQGATVYASNSTGLLFKPDLVSETSALPNSNVTFGGGEMTPASLRDVYNATGLYSKGDLGAGQTIGILDFDGSGTAASDLATYDTMFGLPPPANLTIEAIGPNEPNLGLSYGWQGEISIDLQVSHTMAPAAALRLYIGAQAYPLSTVIAQIVQEDKVTTLSQSFGQGCECGFSIFEPGTLFYSQITLTDQYYQMGALEGITFTASTGDSGGSGASNGPAGAMAYPASSPWVVAVGGTQTYVSNMGNGAVKFAEGAWSSYGFVSEGGSGGVSYLEPKPWYQSSQSDPPSFPSGRLEPDLALQAGLDPGVEIIQSGQVAVYGGTSVASPLFAGLLTLVSQATGKPLGMIDPFLYSLGNSAALYTKAFHPITVGYNIPWTSSFGYNLATGWGSPNIGEIAHLYSTIGPAAGLSVAVQVTNETGGSQVEFTNGQAMKVQATVTDAGTPVTTGSFAASLSTLGGVSLSTPLTYNSTLSAWTSTLTMGSESGVAYVDVSGSSSGLTGGGFQEIFAGYVANFQAPDPLFPYVTGPSVSLTVAAQVEDLAGNFVDSTPITVAVDSYSIITNSYTKVDQITLSPKVVPPLGPVVVGSLNGSYPPGPIDLYAQGDVYGILPFIEGIWLQNTEISPAVFAAPGAVAPGQTIFVDTDPLTPANLGCPISFDDGVFGSYCTDLSTGSNVTATLVNSLGATVSTASLQYEPCAEALHVCGGGASSINGYLPVPRNAAPGLYTILLSANYSSLTALGDFGVENINGSFYGQILVSNGETTPRLTLNSSPIALGSNSLTVGGPIFEGETLGVVAYLAYPNGTAITNGIYTAIFYPAASSNDYRVISHTEYAASKSVTLQYDPALYAWVGNFTLPSPYGAGSLSSSLYNSFYYAGPYDVYVNGHSFDGVPTTTNESSALPFYVQPYTQISGQTISSEHYQGLDAVIGSSGWALSDDTLNLAGVSGVVSLSGDAFSGTNTISGGTAIISGSSISGTLNVNNATLTLVGVSGEGDSIVATGSAVILEQSDVGGLTLTGSTISVQNSYYQSISPAPLTLLATGVSAQPVNGTASIVVSAAGKGASSLNVWLDGTSVGTSSGTQVTVLVNASQLADGVHTLTATATQSDGLTASATWYLSTDAHLMAKSGSLQGTQNQLQATQNQLQSTNNTLASTQKSLTQATDILYVTLVVAAIALVVAVVAVLRKPGF